ncbi:hypothetical protein BZA70DRAFT_266966 [Myxozyma melibiosi]|uniref:C3H1-type domain-containing protein n=1 Tax=Myxozyma melibiosi TaxID=54550 RepID=A0ABR1F7P3_9ASCO
MDNALKAECERILSDPTVLDEEQTDQISGIIEKHYAQKGQLLTAADLDALVLDTLWRHREGSSGAKSSSSAFGKAAGGGGGGGGGAGGTIRKKVIRHKFPSPIAVVRPPAVGYSAAVMSATDTGSSLPSTRSTSPESIFGSTGSAVHFAGSGYSYTGGGFSSVMENSASPNSYEPSFSQDEQVGSSTPESQANAVLADLTSELGGFDPFGRSAGASGVGDDDDDYLYRPLTQAQKQQLQQEQKQPDQQQQQYSYQYTDYGDNSPFENYESSHAVVDPASLMPIAPSTGSSASSPSTVASSFTALAAANGAVYSPAGSHTPLTSSTPTLSASTPTALADDVSSPFEHIRAALMLPAAANLPDSAIVASLDRNGYDITVTLNELYDKLSGRVSSVAQNVKVQTIGPAYSMPVSSTSGKDQAKIPTVCRYFLTTGQCARQDCRFVHDLSATVCRYWLQNSCLAGSTCVFLHSIPPELLARLESRAQGAATILPGAPSPRQASSSSLSGGGGRKNITLADENEFPALPTEAMATPTRKASAGKQQHHAANHSNSNSNSALPSMKATMEDFPGSIPIKYKPLKGSRKHRGVSNGSKEGQGKAAG